MKTTETEKLFVAEYIRNGFNGRRAYMKIYKTDNETSASSYASQLLKKERIQKVIENEEGGYKDIARKLKLDKKSILKQLAKIIYETTAVKDKLGNWLEVPNTPKDINAAIITVCKLTGDFAPEKTTIEVESGELTEEDLAKKTPEELEEIKEAILKRL
jgi:hypothetical protein